MKDGSMSHQILNNQHPYLTTVAFKVVIFNYFIFVTDSINLCKDVFTYKTQNENYLLVNIFWTRKQHFQFGRQMHRD